MAKIKRHISNPKKNSDFVKIFKSFLNCKYKWGGKTFEGIDCSALLQIFYKFNNNFFPRDTIDQVKLKKGVDTKKNLKKVILFFGKDMLLYASIQMILSTLMVQKKK